MRSLVSLFAVAGVLLLPLGDADARRKRKPPKKKPPPAEETKPVEEAAEPPDAPDGGVPPGEAAGMRSEPPGPTAPAQPTPPPAPPPTSPVPEAPSADVDVDSLRQEYLKLRDELFESRARAATVASAVFSTRIQVKLAFTTGRFYGVTRAVVRLDGASVYDDTGGKIASDDAVRFDGWIAPGRHVLTFRVETVGKDDERFTSATEATIVVQAIAGKDLAVIAKASDGGDIAYEWKRKEKGGYRLGIDVDVRTMPRAAAAEGKKTARAK
jgi:hypothetical protein